jgi:hypothetical protein
MTRVPIIGILAPRFPPSTVTGYRVDSFTTQCVWIDEEKKERTKTGFDEDSRDFVVRSH